MRNKVLRTIEKYQMLESGDRLLIGVSGGADSVALLHVMSDLRIELGIELFVAHLDHCFRGRQSEEDAEFVQQLTNRMGIPTAFEKIEVAEYAQSQKLSFETAAREIRYEFFQRAKEMFQCNKLATAHNSNDQVETVLFNLFRGSGLAGLGGIPPVRDKWVIRPLIEVSRQEILEYIKTQQLTFRTDPTNFQTDYTRNKIRLELIPQLQNEYNPNLLETLVRTSTSLREDQMFLTEMTDSYAMNVLSESNGAVTISNKAFYKIPIAIQNRLIRKAWQILGSGSALENQHVQSCRNFIVNGQTGSMLNLPNGILLLKKYDKCVFIKSDYIENVVMSRVEYRYLLNLPGITEVPESGIKVKGEYVSSVNKNLNDKNEIVVDLDKVTPPFYIRSRKVGDWFQPSGMMGSKKLKKFFVDEKIDRDKRDRIPVIVDAQDEIIWVVGLRQDRRWEASEETIHPLQLSIQGIQ